MYIESRGRLELHAPPRGWVGNGIIALVRNQEFAKELRRLQLPVINVSEEVVVPKYDFPQVTTDIDASARLGLSHFVDRGFNHFAYAGPMGYEFVQRHYGCYRDLVAVRGSECPKWDLPPMHVAERGWAERMERLQAWLLELPKPVAVFCWGGDSGRTIIDACRYANIPIPHDVAILGSDHNDVLCDASRPSLSGILAPAKQIGWTAARMLDQLMQGKTLSEQEVCLPPDRVIDKLSTDTIAIEDEHMVQALTYIHEHAFQEIKVSDVLHKVPMSRRLMEKKFQKYLGRSPMEEVRRLRIGKARTLLVDTDMPMQAIAEACGYATYNYMTHIFKRETGVSPTAYRASMRIHNLPAGEKA